MKKCTLLIALILFVGLTALRAQNVQITGTVTSAEDGSTIPGATVKVKGNNAGVVTDASGKFSISVSPNSTLIFSFIGTKTQEIELSGQKIIDVKLVSDVIDINEVVVTGYGDFKKKTFTGSASIVNTDNLKDIPSISPTDLLQGNSSGVLVGNSSGQAGAVPQIRIRGVGSFNASQDPLYVIDGVPASSGNLSDLASSYNASGNSILSSINPSDIESLTVIKDAAAASLYGSRAANGVVIITTKKGKYGRTEVSFKSDFGKDDLAVKYRPTLNGEQRRALIYEGLVNYGTDKGYANPTAYADSKIDTYAPIPSAGWVDWRKELLRKGDHQNYELSLSSGNDKTTVYSSLAYTKQGGITYNSDYERVTGRLNVNHKLSKKAEFGASLTFARIKQLTNNERSSYSNPFMNIAGTVIPSDQVYDSNGDWNRVFAGNSALNPKQSAELNKNTSKLTQTRNTIWGSYEFIEGLKLKQTLTYDYSTANDFVYWDARTKDGESFNGLGQKDFYEKGKLNSATNLLFTKTIANKHHIDALVAYEIEDNKYDFLYAARANYPNFILHDLDNASEDQGSNSNATGSRLLSYVSRLNYDFDNKYFLGGSFRTDGSSRLASKNRWGKFWSASAAWVVSKEDFLKDFSYINNLKVRSSYGVNGTQPSDLYGYLGTYSYGNNYNNSPGSAESTVPNPDLKWETNYSLNFGVDVTVFDRLSVTVDWFNRDTKDLLQDVPASGTTGFTSYLANIGKMNNKGWELEITSDNLKGSDFKWTTTFTASWIRNKVLKLDGEQNQIVNTESIYTTNKGMVTKVGQSFYSFYLKEFAGVNPQTGAAQFYTNTLDGNGNYKKDITEDVTKAQQIAIKGKYADPKMYGGISNTFSYKGIDLSFLFTYSTGGYTYDAGASFYQADGYRSLYNISTDQLNRWQKPGDNTNVPRFVYGNANGGQNATTRRLHSSDYIRLKNASLGYNIPSNLTKTIGIENARIYFSGSNLLTWAAYDLYDPETRPNGVVAFNTPPLKTYTFGLEVKF